MSRISLFDGRACVLGEGPLWHPERQQLFWFDILAKRLMSQRDGREYHWQFDEFVSAAGWINHSELLIASETRLFRFNVDTDADQTLCYLEANNSATRSNDGRADPRGGFWIGTMGLSAEPGYGAIYRYYQGELRQLYPNITIANAICFSPEGQYAYYSDSPTQMIMRQNLTEEGWPLGDPVSWLDLQAENHIPDGAVVDSEGCLWSAQWGSGRVARYSADAVFLEAHNVDASLTTCPAFGGPGLDQLFITSACDGLAEIGELDGRTLATTTAVRGQFEHQVILQP